MAGVKEACAVCGVVKWTYARGLCRICYSMHRDRFPCRINPSSFPRTAWTDDRLEVLHGIINEGLTYSLAAAQMGVTKNTIAGACSRNGITPKPFTTSAQRLDALTAKLDAAMALPVKRVPNT